MKLKNLPHRIFLQVGSHASDFNELQQVSWSDKRSDDSDVEYVRATIKVIEEEDDDDDDDDGRDEEFYQEQRERELEERAGNCSCGAWQITKSGTVIHVADCCCGAE
jgi:hypothetical protein